MLVGGVRNNLETQHWYGGAGGESRSVFNIFWKTLSGILLIGFYETERKYRFKLHDAQDKCNDARAFCTMHTTMPSIPHDAQMWLRDLDF